MSDYVLDASAVLALLNQEPGAGVVEQALMSAGTIIGAVNYAEVVAKLAALKMPVKILQDTMESLGLSVYNFDQALAEQTGLLYTVTHTQGLSLGDRSCLALAKHVGLPALTADRAWSKLKLDIKVRTLR